MHTGWFNGFPEVPWLSLLSFILFFFVPQTLHSKRPVFNFTDCFCCFFKFVLDPSSEFSSPQFLQISAPEFFLKVLYLREREWGTDGAEVGRSPD